MSKLEQNGEEQVRRRAYELWERAGQPDGLHEEFWHQAAEELMTPSGTAAGSRGENTSPEPSTAGAAGRSGRS